MHQQHPWTITTAVDTQLCERYELHPFDLIRLRRDFHLRGYGGLSFGEKRAHAEGATCPRFALMVKSLRDVWTSEQWQQWLAHLEHSQRDIDEMCRGEYPITPYFIRVWSALFGIKVDWLLLGTVPAADRQGACIDAWTMTSVARR